MINVNVEDLKEKIDNGEKIVLIDVRTPAEVSRGKIDGSINIPLDTFENDIENKVSDKNENVYLYCLSGSRSQVAAEIMDRKEYKNVFNVISGMLAWRVKGYPINNG